LLHYWMLMTRQCCSLGAAAGWQCCNATGRWRDAAADWGCCPGGGGRATARWLQCALRPIGAPIVYFADIVLHAAARVDSSHCMHTCTEPKCHRKCLECWWALSSGIRFDEGCLRPLCSNQTVTLCNVEPPDVHRAPPIRRASCTSSSPLNQLTRTRRYVARSLPTWLNAHCACDRHSTRPLTPEHTVECSPQCRISECCSGVQSR
jgi:hypothetical protein